jgi:anaerobic C4-dicarboxylate transporter
LQKINNINIIMRAISIIAISVAAVISTAQAYNQYYAFSDEPTLIHEISLDTSVESTIGQTANDLFTRLRNSWSHNIIAG